MGDGSLDGAGVMNACVFDVVYDGVSDVVCNVVDDSVSGDEGCGKVKDCSISGFEDSNRSVKIKHPHVIWEITSVR